MLVRIALLLFITLGSGLSAQCRQGSVSIPIEGTIFYTSRAFVLPQKGGGYVLAYTVKADGTYNNEPKGIYIKQLDREYRIKGESLYYKGYALRDILIHSDNSLGLLIEKKIGPGFGIYNLYQIYAVRLTLAGKELFRTALFPARGYDVKKHHRSQMSTRAKIGFAAGRYSVHMEVSRDFAASGAKANVHMGDYFVQLDSRGHILKNTIAAWNASHSSLNHLLVSGKEAFTILVGDAYPWGFQYRGYFRKRREMQPVVLYPKKTRYSMKNMHHYGRSSTDAGNLNNLLLRGQYLYMVAATVPGMRQPILKQNKDLIFFRFSKKGKVLTQRWVQRTPAVNEYFGHLASMGPNFLLLYFETVGEYGLSGQAKYVILDGLGRRRNFPIATQLPMNAHSNFYRYPNGDPGWTWVKHGTAVIKISRLFVPENYKR